MFYYDDLHLARTLKKVPITPHQLKIFQLTLYLFSRQLQPTDRRKWKSTRLKCPPDSRHWTSQCLFPLIEARMIGIPSLLSYLSYEKSAIPFNAPFLLLSSN
ncbi:hypothetical protein CDAR_225141 [Caerostris darwini]|uniref:Uncharacterized protein n=1 Tax=Caerostris darwini TaxID=1538125 RepID=A0AAV4T709_9ARAC|nr:hypothetical protein CDAR_225141 [Caerostris darwini]